MTDSTGDQAAAGRPESEDVVATSATDGTAAEGDVAGEVMAASAPSPVEPAEAVRPAAVGTGPKGKVRSPLGGWLLLFPTLGIYYLFWYHHINREMRDYDPAIDVSPGLAVLAQFVPIVNLVSIYNTGKRIQQAQATAGAAPEASGGLGVIGAIVMTLVLPYYNSQLNRAWKR